MIRRVVIFCVSGALLGISACNNPVFPSCNFDVTVSTPSFQATGGSGAVTVTPNPGRTACAWTAKATGGFISLTGSASGTGQKTFGYTVSPNSSGTARTGQITVEWSGNGSGSKDAVVSQSGVTNNLSVNPTSQSVGFGGQTGLTAAVTANVAWTATSNQSFVTITSGGSGTGNGTITYDVAANAGAGRTATITVSGGGLTSVLTVTQDVVTNSLSLNPTAQSVVAGGQNGLTISVTSNVSWTAAASGNFVTITSGTSGTGNGTITYNVAANTGALRTATITVAGGGTSSTVTITQNPVSNSLVLSPTSQTVAFGGQTGLTTAVTSNVAWSATASQPWITITNGSPGSGNGTITYNVASNAFGAARSGTITVTGSGLTSTLTINQDSGQVSVAIQSPPTNTSTGGGPNLCELTGFTTIRCRFDAIVTGPQSLVSTYEFTLQRPCVNTAQCASTTVTESLNAPVSTNPTTQSFVVDPQVGCGWPPPGSSIQGTVFLKITLTNGTTINATPLPLAFVRNGAC